MTNFTIKPNFFHYNGLNFGDKSITHRALIFGAISKGETVITNANLCDDCNATIDCLKKLGAKFTISNDSITVKGITNLNEDIELYCGNSGTTARLLVGLTSGLNIHAKFYGDNSLINRPMRNILPLTQMGAKILPLTNGIAEVFPSTLCPIEYKMDIVSAQVKSSVLLAGLNASGQTTVIEKQKTRLHTESMIKMFGGNVTMKKNAITVSKSALVGQNVFITNDTSTASFLIALGLFYGNISLKKVLISTARAGLIDLLISSGANITLTNMNNVGLDVYADIIVEKSHLQPLICPATLVSRMIDEIPVACVIASKIVGESVFYGLKELTIKESNRLETIVKMLNCVNVSASIFDGENICVNGNGIIDGGKVSVFSDHRIAMSSIILGILSQNGVVIDDCQCIDVSCPNFLQMLGLKNNNTTKENNE